MSYDLENATSTQLDNLLKAIDLKLHAKEVAAAAYATNRALKTNASGRIEVSDVTDAELEYLDGVTSAIQTQLDAKVTKLGDNTISGIKTFTNVLTIDVTNTKIGFFGLAVLVAKQAWIALYDLTASVISASSATTLTSAAGTPGAGTADVTGSFDQTILNNNFATLVGEVNKLKTLTDDLKAEHDKVIADNIGLKAQIDDMKTKLNNYGLTSTTA